ncbi:hypothetical protein FSP39_002434 [Pinctada imbricata]|uniref:Uncharacterized protein n=1 Tax=Pinctada imbricata TaxID=66713 RepID=A0AA88YH01_PINIB|nr:hypothetical protein FSP39_002434 [Pinctada imbricata]
MMDPSSSDFKHLKRRQSFDEKDEKSAESSGGNDFHADGGHKKTRYSWQIKGVKSSQLQASNSTHIGEMPHQQENLILVDGSSSSSHCEQENGIGSNIVKMEESMCDDMDGTHSDQQHYSGGSVELPHQPHQEASTSQTTEAVQYGGATSSSRPNFFPNVRCNLFPYIYNHSMAPATDLVVYWQNKHLAKSLVDNAINKTIEEMGVQPGKEQDVEFMADKSELENQGISEAIKCQGLVGPSHHGESDSQTELHVPPLLSHLRELSELMFTQTTSNSSRLNDTISQQQSVTAYPLSSMTSSARSLDSSGHRTLHHHDSLQQQRPNVSEPPTENVTNVPSSNSEVLDQAVSLVISKQGLTLQ